MENLHPVFVRYILDMAARLDTRQQQRGQQAYGTAWRAGAFADRAHMVCTQMNKGGELGMRVQYDDREYRRTFFLPYEPIRDQFTWPLPFVFLEKRKLKDGE